MLDNYDSFVYNLARYLEELGEKVELVRNDRIRIDQIEAMLGVMPVVSLGEHRFLSGNTGHELLAKYREFCDNTEK